MLIRSWEESRRRGYRRKGGRSWERGGTEESEELREAAQRCETQEQSDGSSAIWSERRLQKEKKLDAANQRRNYQLAIIEEGSGPGGGLERKFAGGERELGLVLFSFVNKKLRE